jgi:hypothetical protein
LLYLLAPGLKETVSKEANWRSNFAQINGLASAASGKAAKVPRARKDEIAARMFKKAPDTIQMGVETIDIWMWCQMGYFETIVNNRMVLA